MKLTIFLLTVALLHVSAKGVSQTVSFSGENVSLESLFKVVKKQTGFVVFYKEDMLKAMAPVSISAKDMPLEDFLKAIFENQPVTFFIRDKTIVLGEREIAKQPDASSATPETIKIATTPIKGHLVDEDGKPAIGITVTIKGSKTAVETDNNGNFIINVSVGDKLILTSVEFERREIPITSSSKSIDLILSRRTVAMKDVVVNKGFYSQKQEFNTGNVSVVTAKEIEKQPVTDPIQALQGRVPGLSISQASGMPGASSTVQLRGQNSINNGNRPVSLNNPLYLVDGVPYSSETLTSSFIGGGAFQGPVTNSSIDQTGMGISPFNSLNINDIESIEILKDADATAIYGARGANGVILITTKKGKAGKTRLDANIWTGVNSMGKEYKLLDTKQYLSAYREAYSNSGVPFPDINTNPYDVNFDLNGVWDTTRYTDWQKVLIGNTAQFTNANLSLSGGNPNTQFLLSGTYSSNGFTFPGDYTDQKIGIHGNFNQSSTNQRLKVGFTIDYTNDNNNAPLSDLTSLITLAPDAPPLYDKNGGLNWAPYPAAGYLSTWPNPLASTNNQAQAITDNTIAHLNISYQITEDLQVSGLFGYNHIQMNSQQINRSTSVQPPYNLEPTSRSFAWATNDNKNWNIEPQLNYHHQISRFKFDALVGGTIIQTNSKANAYTANGYGSDDLIEDPQAATSKYFSGYSVVQYKYSALYGRVGINLDDKYILNFTGSRNGSSRFGPSRQYANFGAASAGWIFSREEAIKEFLPWLSFGKLRVSYGAAGNDAIGDYQYLSTYNVTALSYQGNPGLNPTSLYNPYFAWEVNHKLEGGMELGFLKDRINITASYYQNRTGNQLVGYPLPLVSGFGSVQQNLNATIQNTGVELTFNTINISNGNLTWTTAINLSIPRNKLISFPNLANTSYAQTYEVGKSINVVYLYHYTGVDPQTGLYTFSTQSGSGSNPDYENDRHFLDVAKQSYFGGMNNSFRYKGFQLDVFFQIVKQMGVNYLNSFSFALGSTNNLNYPVEILNRWQKSGDRALNQQYSVYYQVNVNYNNYINSDGVNTDASFIRLKNVSLSYQLPATWIKKSFLKSASVFMNGQNLLTITNYRGLDPETQNMYVMPPMRTIVGGVRLSL